METTPQKVERICCVCDSTEKVHKHRRTENLYGMSCLALDDSKKEICTECDEIKPVYKRLKGGKPQCQSCYQRENYRKMKTK